MSSLFSLCLFSSRCLSLSGWSFLSCGSLGYGCLGCLGNRSFSLGA